MASAPDRPGNGEEDPPFALGQAETVETGRGDRGPRSPAPSPIVRQGSGQRSEEPSTLEHAETVSGQVKPTPGGAADVVRVAAGTMIGKRYQVGEHLGTGGMGTVYAATDLLVDQQVALKFVRPSLASDHRERERLRGEVRLAQSVTSVHVARTFNLDEQDGQLFIVMELLRGKTLAARLRESPRLTVGEALAIADQLLLGLAAAHGRGILHRDIKPGNVKLADDGRAVLMDFGMARSSESSSPPVPLDDEKLKVQITHTLLGGTPGYIAPELLRGRRGDVRADLYSFGVMLHEMIAGHALFRGLTAQQNTRAHLEDVPLRLDEIRAEVPRHVADAVARLLGKDPADRPGSAEEVRRLLARPRASTPRPVPPPARRSWPLLFAGAVVVGGAAAVWALSGGDEPRPPPPIAPVPTPAVAAPPAVPVLDAAVPPMDATPVPVLDAGPPARRPARPRPPPATPPPAPPAETRPPPDDAAERRRRQLELEDL